MSPAERLVKESSALATITDLMRPHLGDVGQSRLSQALDTLRDGLRGKNDRAADAIPRQPPRAPIDWDELQGDPPARSWWIQDWLSPDPTLVAGLGGTGKTRLWQAICTSLVTGKTYLETAAVRGMRSLTWSCEENQDEVWRNQAAINAHFGLTMADLMGLHIVPRRGEENTLLAPVFGIPTLTPAFETLREQVNDLKADVLVLDNIAQIYGGALNDPHQVTMFVNALAGLVTDRPFAPVLLGHVAKSVGSEFSGSAAWENAVRMRWYLGPTLPDQKQDEEPAANPDVVYLARRKANFTGKDWLRLKFQEGVLVPDVPEGRRFDQAYREDAAERVVLSGMTRLSAMGITATDGKTSPDYLPKQILAKKLGENHTRDELTSAMNRLMTNMRLKRAVIGQYANRANRYGLIIS